MSFLTLLEGFGLVIWALIAFGAARIVQLAQRHAEMRDLELPVVVNTFGDERRTLMYPIGVRNELAVVWSYINAGLVAVIVLLWLMSRQDQPVVFILLTSVVTAMFMARWFIDYRSASDARERDLPATYPVRVHLPQG